MRTPHYLRLEALWPAHQAFLCRAYDTLGAAAGVWGRLEVSALRTTCSFLSPLWYEHTQEIGRNH